MMTRWSWSQAAVTPRKVLVARSMPCLTASHGLDEPAARDPRQDEEGERVGEGDLGPQDRRLLLVRRSRVLEADDVQPGRPQRHRHARALDRDVQGGRPVLRRAEAPAFLCYNGRSDQRSHERQGGTASVLHRSERPHGHCRHRRAGWTAQSALISIRCSLAGPAFGSRRCSTPPWTRAEIPAGSTASDRVKLRS